MNIFCFYTSNLIFFVLTFLLFCDIILIEDGGAAEIPRICDARGRMAAVFILFLPLLSLAAN